VRRSVQKMVLGASLAGALAVLVVALLRWRDFVYDWHVGRFRGTPGAFEEALRDRGPTLRREAFERFIDTPEGGEALLRVYADLFLRDALPDFRRTGVVHALVTESDTILIKCSCWSPRHLVGTQQYSSTNDSVIAALARLFPRLRGRPPFQLPEEPGFRFRAVTFSEALDVAPHLDRNIPPLRAVSCLIERMPEGAVPILAAALKSSRRGPFMVPFSCAQVLGRMGPEARGALPDLENLRGSLPIPLPASGEEIDTVLERIAAARAIAAIRAQPFWDPLLAEGRDAFERGFWRILLRLAGRSPKEECFRDLRWLLAGFLEVRERMKAGETGASFEARAFLAVLAFEFVAGRTSVHWLEAAEAIVGDLSPSERGQILSATHEAGKPTNNRGNDAEKAKLLRNFLDALRQALGPRFRALDEFLRGLGLSPARAGSPR
jgi:hypothetical protein